MSGYRELPLASEVELDEAEYKLPTISAPVLTGHPLRLFAALSETSLFGPLREILRRNNGIPQALSEIYLPDAMLPAPDVSNYYATMDTDWEDVVVDTDQDPCETTTNVASLLWDESIESVSSPLPSIIDYHMAYKSGKIAPSQVAENIIKAIADSEVLGKLFISHDPEDVRRAALESDFRHRMGAERSPLDGVPFAVKDLIDVYGYPTTLGTAFMSTQRPVTATAPCIQGLLDAGAILIGKSNTHEIGLGTTGLNTVTGTPRNPHNPAHHTGGSSSGSAAIVASGLCPFAIGSDGGGSIRIPASLCGVVGLKPTDGRVCNEPHAAIDNTVAVVGPITATVKDAALVLSVMANRGHEQHGLKAPPSIKFCDLNNLQKLQGRKVGVYWPWFKDADPEVVAACRNALEVLEKLGLEVVEVSIPELDLLKAAHMCTITSEMRNNMNQALTNSSTRAMLNLETRISLSIAAGFSSAEYIQAQKIRKRLDCFMRRVFESVDFVVTPTTPITAPRIRPEALVYGQTDVGTTTTLMRFAQLANMLGLPALSLPVGYDAAGLPIGLQLMAAPYCESALLFAGIHFENLKNGFTRAAAVQWDILGVGGADNDNQ